MESPDEVKQVIIVARKFPDGRGGTMGPRTGKMIAQACHASIAFVVKPILATATSRPDDRWNPLSLSSIQFEWMRNGQRKIALQMEDSEALVELHRIASASGLESNLITDCGYTEFKGETITALAIGPDLASKIDPIAKHLRLM